MGNQSQMRATGGVPSMAHTWIIPYFPKRGDFHIEKRMGNGRLAFIHNSFPVKSKSIDQITCRE